jgi:hypothetical protein
VQHIPSQILSGLNPVIEPGLMGGFCSCFEIKAPHKKAGGKDKKSNIMLFVPRNVI